MKDRALAVLGRHASDVVFFSHADLRFGDDCRSVAVLVERVNPLYTNPEGKR